VGPVGPIGPPGQSATGITFFAYQNADRTISSFTATTTSRTFSLYCFAELYDTNGNYDLSKGYYEAPFTGVYEFSFGAKVTITSSAQGGAITLQMGLDLDDSLNDSSVSIIIGSVQPNIVTVPVAAATAYYTYHTAQVSLTTGQRVTPKILLSNITTSKSLGPIVIQPISGQSTTATFISGKFLG
jgi:hypothetical protein